jgi:hypothetical protein
MHDQRGANTLMPEEYDPRQDAGSWPADRWSLDGTPVWYRELLAQMAGKLTAWREHDPPQRLDPRCDPRKARHRLHRRAIS